MTEDFAPFDLNVTTIDPGVEALVRSGAGDTQWGVRVVVTEDKFANCNCGGFAYIGSFGSSCTAAGVRVQRESGRRIGSREP